MIPLTVTDDVAGVLGGYIDAVEVRDSQGHLLGHFLPYLTSVAREFYAHPEAFVDLEECKRRADAARGQEGHTHEQVMQHLRSLDRGQ
jgi:hypothetical protein